MEVNQQNNEQKKPSKDFIWLIIGIVVLIVGLMMLKTIMHQIGVLG